MQPTNGGLYVILTQQEKILDAIIITEILNKNHEAVMADPPSCSTGMDKIKNFGILEMGVVTIYIYIYICTRTQQKISRPQGAALAHQYHASTLHHDQIEPQFEDDRSVLDGT